MGCTNAEKRWNVSLGPKEQRVADNTQRKHSGRNKQNEYHYTAYETYCSSSRLTAGHYLVQCLQWVVHFH